VINTLHFAIAESDGTLLVPLATIAGAINTLYVGLNSRIQAYILRDQSYVKMYDLRQSRPQVPIYDAPLWSSPQAPTGTAEDLPAEVALVASFQGARLSGAKQSRRRGRNYIGPFRSSGTVDHKRPATADINQVVTAYDTLLTSSLSAALWKWTVFSPTNAGGFYLPGGSGPPFWGGDAMVPVTNGWVDNAWDTQRRRGLTPNARTTFS
jgi:hypothetical protein